MITLRNWRSNLMWRRSAIARTASTFGDYGVLPELAAKLSEQGIVTPTEVQRKVNRDIPQIRAHA